MTLTELRKIAKDVPVTEFHTAQQWLRGLYSKAKSVHPSWSWAQFSLTLGWGSANAHSICGGKRKLTPKAAQKVAELLKLNKSQAKYLLATLNQQNANGVGDRQKAFDERIEIRKKLLPNRVEQNRLEFFAKWHHAVVLEVLRLPDASDDPKWIIKKLQLPLTLGEAKESLALLESLDLIKFDEGRGRLFPTEVQISTGNEVQRLAILSYHRQMLQLSTQALDQVSASQRDISASTMRLSEAAMAELKDDLIALRKKYLQLGEDLEDPDRVVQLNLQMFSLTDKDSK